MTTMLILLLGLTIIFLLIAVFLVIIFCYKLFSLELPALKLNKFRLNESKDLRIIAICPHPDDEIFLMGGTLAKFAKQKDVSVTLLTVTKGEAGETGGLCYPKELGEFRTKELQNSVEALGIHKLVLWDFPDGRVNNNFQKLNEKLDAFLRENKFDVAIVYDESGIYGHPDHITVTESVRKVISELPTAAKPKLLFATMPGYILDQAKLPKTINLYGQIVELNSTAKSRAKPKYKEIVWNEAPQKISAIFAHKTQNIAKHLPVPLWLYRFVGSIEYFSED